MQTLLAAGDTAHVQWPERDSHRQIGHTCASFQAQSRLVDRLAPAAGAENRYVHCGILHPRYRHHHLHRNRHHFHHLSVRLYLYLRSRSCLHSCLLRLLRCLSQPLILILLPDHSILAFRRPRSGQQAASVDHTRCLAYLRLHQEHRAILSTRSFVAFAAGISSVSHEC